jgi:uncharacterized membrane protein
VRRLIWVGVGIAVAVVVVHQVSRSAFGQRFRQSMAEHETALRAALLPDEETLAAARETRAQHGRHKADDRSDDVVVFPDDDTDYF